MRALSIALSAAVIALSQTTLAAEPSPYAGEQTRTVKALSAAEIADLEAGRGMGLARAGELNGYPGPAHVLELADALGLTPAQRDQVTEIRMRMTAAAKPLGAQIIAKERILDQSFADGTIDPTRLAAATEAIGTLRGKLRAVHLAAHLETKRVLTLEQIRRYDGLRGYGPAPTDHHHLPGHDG